MTTQNMTQTISHMRQGKSQAITTTFKARYDGGAFLHADMEGMVHMILEGSKWYTTIIYGKTRKER